MPELPEVETIRRDLEKEVIGRRVKTVEVKGKRSVRRHKSGPEFRDRLRAKGPKDPMATHTHVVITFTQGGQLRFVDPRTFGEMFVTATDELETVPELSHLGFDPLEEVMSWARFGQLLADRHTQLKTLLMDQKFVAGIGNIYSDEILFAAGLRYDRGSDSLSAQEIRRLYRAMVETLSEAVKYRGSSLADEQYRDLFGAIGDYQGRSLVLLV